MTLQKNRKNRRNRSRRKIRTKFSFCPATKHRPETGISGPETGIGKVPRRKTLCLFETALYVFIDCICSFFCHTFQGYCHVRIWSDEGRSPTLHLQEGEDLPSCVSTEKGRKLTLFLSRGEKTYPSEPYWRGEALPLQFPGERRKLTLHHPAEGRKPTPLHLPGGRSLTSLGHATHIGLGGTSSWRASKFKAPTIR